jgi:hypothetical protein
MAKSVKKAAMGSFMNPKLAKGIKEASDYGKKMKPYYENLINKKASEFEKDQELKKGKFKKGGSLSPTKKSVGKTIGKLNKAKSGSKVSKKKK